MKTLKLLCAAGLLVNLAVFAAEEPKKDAKPDAKPETKSEEKKPAAASPGFADPAKLTEKSPESFKAQFETTKGKFTIEVTRSLSPNGADRFYNLIRSGYFKDVAFFRVIPGFMCQFGIHGDPKVSAAWRAATISDDPVKASNARGAITFATAGPNTRTTQLFINFGDNAGLDGQGFSSFGKVTEGMDVVDKINGEYGEGAPRGRGPDQGRIQTEGNVYLKKDFPNLDYIKSASILP
ncbi:MAG: peptidylprolyl isomerase [Verrucomicrobia bacterium]|nr:MAG: peptidylprolyl isomerase [Verrucomicrobiota bacterium]